MRVTFQRCHAFTSRHVPDLEHSWRINIIPITRNDPPPVRKHRDALDLRRRHVITKVQWTPQRTLPECPSSVATHSPVATSHTLSVLLADRDTTRRPSGNTATYKEDISQNVHNADAACRTGEKPSSVATHLPVATSHTLTTPDPYASRSQKTTRRPSGNTATPLTYDVDTSSQKYSGRRAPHFSRVPVQRRHAFAGLDVPHLERATRTRKVVARPRHNAPPIWEKGKSPNLQRRHIITRIPKKADRAPHRIPVSV